MKKVLVVLLLALVTVFFSGPAQAWPTYQTDAGEAIGIMCSGLLEGYARNPDEESTLITEYENGLQQIKSLPLSRCSSPALGLGIACGGLIAEVARNPESMDTLSDLYEIYCKQEIFALKKPFLRSDLVLGIGHVWDQYLLGIARQPGAMDKLQEARDMCISDIESLGK